MIVTSGTGRGAVVVGAGGAVGAGAAGVSVGAVVGAVVVEAVVEVAVALVGGAMVMADGRDSAASGAGGAVATRLRPPISTAVATTAAGAHHPSRMDLMRRLSQARSARPSRNGCSMKRYETSASPAMMSSRHISAPAPWWPQSTPGRVNTITGQCHR